MGFRRTISVCLLLLTGCGESAGAPPNIVIFLADDLGWGDVGFHGSEIETPAIDQLAQEGLELTAHYVQPVCSPTRAALLTGRYPIRYGFQVGVVRPWSLSGLPTREVLLPELLKRAGYTSHIVGKWHLGSAERAQLPTERGFDHHYGQYTGLIDYWTHERLGGLDWHRDGKPARDEGYSTDLLREEATRIVREHDYAKPLFLYVPFSAPHFPLQAPDELIAHYGSKFESEDRRIYAAMVTSMDRAIGAVLSELEAAQQTERTLVLFFSDNGALLAKGGSSATLRGQKSDLYEGAVRSPTVIRWPGQIEAGERLATPLHVTDWFPTIARLAGVASEAQIDGLDLTEHLTLRTPLAERTILLNTQRKQGALREGRFKLIAFHHLRALAGREQDPTFGLELYDLEADPEERVELGSEHPELGKRLFEQLMAFHRVRSQPFEDHGMAPDDYVPPAVFGPPTD